METIQGRGTVLATVLKKYDLKMMKEHHMKMKKRGEEIEVTIRSLCTICDHLSDSQSRITLLKTPWLDLLSLQEVVESSRSLREWQQPTTSTTIPTLSSARQRASLSTQPSVMMPKLPHIISEPRMTTQVSSPTHSFSHANIRDSPLQSAGNDIHSRIVFDHSQRNTILLWSELLCVREQVLRVRWVVLR